MSVCALNMNMTMTMTWGGSAYIRMLSESLEAGLIELGGEAPEDTVIGEMGFSSQRLDDVAEPRSAYIILHLDNVLARYHGGIVARREQLRRRIPKGRRGSRESEQWQETSKVHHGDDGSKK